MYHSLTNGPVANSRYEASVAARMSLVYGAAYGYVGQHWDQISGVYEGLDTVKTGTGTIQGAIELTKTGKVVGLAGVLSGLIAVMKTVAEQNHVRLDACALSIASVSLDLAGHVVDFSGSISGAGVVLGLMDIVSTGSDLYQLGSPCKLVNTAS